MSGSSGDITKAIINPISGGAKLLGVDMGSNDLLNVLDYTLPMKQSTESYKLASDLLKFNEGSKLTRDVNGTSDTLLEAAKKAEEKMRKNTASDKKALEELSQQGNLLSSGSGVLNPMKAKTGAGKDELQRLLTIFEARQSEISARKARPGASQTRLV